MVSTLGTLFAGLIGLAFGSFLNTCASRWPADEKVTSPRSHCRNCGRTLSWWENLPVLSWLALRGRCRTCKAPIGWRYLFVELSVGILWAYCAWHIFSEAPEIAMGLLDYQAWMAITSGIAGMIFMWLLVALAVLDAENLWLPDRLTIPGIVLGFVLAVARTLLTLFVHFGGDLAAWKQVFAQMIVVSWFLGAVLPAVVLLILRWLYSAIRGQEGMGLGDIKLLSMIGGWIGIKGAALSFGIALGVGIVLSLILFFVPSAGQKKTRWAVMKLPFGTFLCIGGIVSGFWRDAIFAAYLRLSGMQ